MDASAYFKGKKITVMGLGLLGRGVGDVKYLAECGAELTVTDLKSAEQLASSLDELSAYPDITYVLGEHRLEDFRDRDLILKAAGVPLDSVYIAEAEKAGIPVRMSADLFAELAGIVVIGITGTRGKTTTAYLVDAILKQSGKKTFLGGNIRGVSTLALLPEVNWTEVAVLELDSWQLQGFGSQHMSPHIAVFTTFYPDHLNYYKGDLKKYLADKANIFLYQNEGDTLVLGAQASTVVRDEYQDEILADIAIASADDIPASWKLQMPGEHNRYNAACALAVARELQIPDEVSRVALETFAGVPGRLELVREVRGVKIYNDTTATTPEATLAAIAALDPKHTVLIMGGADKTLDMSALKAELPSLKKALYLQGSGTEAMEIAGAYGSLQEAVAAAYAAAEPGDAILFSPAFASFGMFKNEYDRGDQFTSLVQKLI